LPNFSLVPTILAICAVLLTKLESQAKNLLDVINNKIYFAIYVSLEKRIARENRFHFWYFYSASLLFAIIHCEYRYSMRTISSIQKRT